MELKQWVKNRPGTVAEIAAGFRVSRVTLQRWMSGHMLPRPAHIEAIERLSGGEVTARDMVATYTALRVSR